MINRYASRNESLLDENKYIDMLRERNLNVLRYYSTPYFVFPTGDQMKTIDYKEHIWKVGDRFYKLAHEYYGDSRDWWIIAKFNNKPTESHLSVGEVILIPTNLQQFFNTTKG